MNSFHQAFLVFFLCLRAERRSSYHENGTALRLRDVCETCGTVYADKAKAAERQKAHHAPDRIIRARYAPVSGDRTGYPQTLEVLMDDGKTATYKRTGGR